MMALFARGAFLVCAAALILSAAEPARPRLIVLTDIGGDPDDQQSLVRLMTYANEFEIEGLIASASGTPGELKSSIVQPELIREIVAAYGKVRSTLLRHSPAYPDHEALLRLIKSGNPNRGVAHIGAQGDTEASRWIISVVDRKDERPVNISIWGGAHDLAQALWRVRNDRSRAGLDTFVRKIRVHSIGHQDDTGPWIVEKFPELFFVLSNADESDVLGKQAGKIDRRQSVYRGMYLGGDESLTSREWIETNVRTGHGPLGALYPPKTWTAPNPHSALKEGDTPSWFYFLPNGLSDPDHPEWGSWGGRFRHVRGRYYNDAKDQVGDVYDARSTVWRWREAFQNDFEARMDWCVTAEANHPPSAVLNGDRSKSIVRISAKPGDMIRLSASESSDTDGDRLSYRWFHYPEASGLDRAHSLQDAASEAASFRAPDVDSPTDFHIILEVQDNGSPALFAFRRSIIRVSPGNGKT